MRRAVSRSQAGVVIGNSMACALAIVVLCTCTLISPYDATSYENATDLKAASVLLLDKATDPPGDHAEEIASIRLRLRQSYEYEKGKQLNNMTTQQWEIMIDPDRNLMGGFLKKWEAEGPQSPAFIDGVKSNVSMGFDQIISLESGKVKK